MDKGDFGISGGKPSKAEFPLLVFFKLCNHNSDVKIEAEFNRMVLCIDYDGERIEFDFDGDGFDELQEWLQSLYTDRKKITLFYVGAEGGGYNLMVRVGRKRDDELTTEQHRAEARASLRKCGFNI